MITVAGFEPVSAAIVCKFRIFAKYEPRLRAKKAGTDAGFSVSESATFPETPPNGGLFGPHSQYLQYDRTGWLGRQDSNLGMAESKSAALPLGYAPAAGKEWPEGAQSTQDQGYCNAGLAAFQAA